MLSLERTVYASSLVRIDQADMQILIYSIQSTPLWFRFVLWIFMEDDVFKLKFLEHLEYS